MGKYYSGLENNTTRPAGRKPPGRIRKMEIHKLLTLKADEVRKNRKTMTRTTENGKWYIRIDLLFKDGVLLRKGRIERLAKGNAWKHHASWNYGDKDEDSGLQFRGGKLPGYVKDLAIDMGISMKKKWPLTGIDFIDPDYVLED